MSILKEGLADAEAALSSIESFIDVTVWPKIKAFFTLFTPAEANALLGDIEGAVPTAAEEGATAAATGGLIVGAETGAADLVSTVEPEIVAQTEANALASAQAVVAPVTITPSVLANAVAIVQGGVSIATEAQNIVTQLAGQGVKITLIDATNQLSEAVAAATNAASAAATAGAAPSA